MKLSLLLAAVIALLSFQCAPPPPEVDKYKPGAAYQGEHRKAFELGYRYGRSDAIEPRPADPNRYHFSVDPLAIDDFNQGYSEGYRNYERPAQTTSPGYSGRVGDQGLIITRGGRLVATLQPGKPNIEAWHFTEDGRQVVVKSRASHGPAVVELFDAASGGRVDKIPAFAIRYGEPAWARGMQD